MSKNAKPKEVKYIALKNIRPDEIQPRKNFDSMKLGRLVASIKRFGIKQPLTVEPQGGGMFLLQDGERRYRAAKELNLDVVPVVIEEAGSDTERLISQFHLQELHEGWNPMEKATAVARLAESMGATIPEIADLLSLPNSTVKDYVAFGNLLNRKEFEKSEMPITYAGQIGYIRGTIKRGYKKMEIDLPDNILKDMEKVIYEKAKRGDIAGIPDLIKLRRVLTADPTIAEKLIKNPNLPIKKLFDSSDAKAVALKQNMSYGGAMVNGYVKEIIKNKFFKVVKEDENLKRRMKELHSNLTELIRNI